jgi:hypothetical protein
VDDARESQASGVPFSLAVVRIRFQESSRGREEGTPWGPNQTAQATLPILRVLRANVPPPVFCNS